MTRISAVPPRGPERLEWVQRLQAVLADDFAAQREEIADESDLLPGHPGVEEMLDSAVEWWQGIVQAAREVEQLTAWGTL